MFKCRFQSGFNAEEEGGGRDHPSGIPRFFFWLFFIFIFDLFIEFSSSASNVDAFRCVILFR